MHGYKCDISLQFQNIGANPNDENMKGFQFMENPTSYGIGLFSYHAFKKYKLKYLYKKCKESYEFILKNGFEKLCENIKKQNYSEKTRIL